MTQISRGQLKTVVEMLSQEPEVVFRRSRIDQGAHGVRTLAIEFPQFNLNPLHTSRHHRSADSLRTSKLKGVLAVVSSLPEEGHIFKSPVEVCAVCPLRMLATEQMSGGRPPIPS